MRKGEKNKLDALASEMCKKHSNRMCVRCGKRSPNPDNLNEGLQWCHVITRGMLSLRWNLKNCLCLCASCHFWGHKYPIDFSLWLIKNFGEEWYCKLKQTPKSKLLFDKVKTYLENSTPEDCLIPEKIWEQELKL